MLIFLCLVCICVDKLNLKHLPYKKIGVMICISIKFLDLNIYIYIYNITNIYIFKYQDRFKDLSNKTNYIL